MAARTRTGGGTGGGSGSDSSDLTNQLAILQQISQLYDQVNQSLQFQKTSLQEIAALNQQVCNNICVSNYSNASNEIIDLGEAMEAASISTQDFSTNTSKAAKSLTTAAKEAAKATNDFEESADKAKKLGDNLKQSGGMLGGFFNNIKTSLTGMGAAALNGIFDIMDGIGKLTLSIMTFPFSFVNKMFEIAGQGGDNSFALALEDVREEFGNLREGLAKDTIDIHKSMINDTKSLVGMTAFRIFGEDRAAILQEALKTVKALGAAARPFMDKFGKEAVVKLALFQKGLGLSEEATKNLADVAMNSGKDISEVTTELTKMSDAMGKAIGESPKVISRAVGEAMKDLGTFGGATIKELAKSEAYLRKLGTTMEEVKGIMSTFETLDAASESAAKLAQSFGVTVDAFELMQMQDPGQMMDSLRKSFKDAGVDTSKFTRQQYSLLSEITGLDAQTAASAFSINRQGESYDKLGKKADAAAAKQMSEAEALKSVADSIKRLVPSGQQASGIIDALFQGFSTGVQRTSEWRGAMKSLRTALNDVRRAGREIGTAFVKYFPGVKDMLTGLKDMFSGGKFRKFTQGFSKDLKKFFQDLSAGKQSFPELFKKLKEKFFNYFSAASPQAKKMIDGIKKFLKTMAQTFAGLIKEVSKSLAEGIRNIGKGGTIDKGVSEAGDTIGFIFKDLYAPVLEAVWEAIKEIFSAIFDRLVEWFPSALASVGQKLFGFLTGTFSGAFTSFGGAIRAVVLTTFLGIISPKVIQIFQNVFTPIIDTIKSLFSFGGNTNASSAGAAASQANKFDWKSLGKSVLMFGGFLLLLAGVFKLGLLQYIFKEFSKLKPEGIINFGLITVGLLLVIKQIGETLDTVGNVNFGGFVALFAGFILFLGILSGIVLTGLLSDVIKEIGKLDEAALLKFGIITAGLARLLSLIPIPSGAVDAKTFIAIGVIMLGFGLFIGAIYFLLQQGILQETIKKAAEINSDDLIKFALVPLALVPAILAAGAITFALSKMGIDFKTLSNVAAGLLGVGLVLVGVAAMVAFISPWFANVSESDIKKMVNSMNSMIPFLFVAGLLVLALSLIGVIGGGGAIVGPLLAGVLAVGIVIAATALTIYLAAEAIGKIDDASLKKLPEALMSMIPVLLGASIVVLAAAGVGALVATGIGLIAILIGLVVVNQVISETVNLIKDLQTKFDELKIDTTKVAAITSTMQSMLSILLQTSIFIAATAAISIVLSSFGVLAVFTTLALIAASFALLYGIGEKTKDLLTFFQENKIEKGDVNKVVGVLGNMIELLKSASEAMVSMGKGAIVGLVGAVASGIGKLFGASEKTDPFLFLQKLMTIVSDNIKIIKDLNISESDIKAFQAFNIAVEGVTVLTKAAAEFIDMSTESVLKVTNDGDKFNTILLSMNTILGTLLGPNGIQGIITQLTSFIEKVAINKDMEGSAKTFAALLDSTAKIMSAMSGGMSDLSSKIAENIDEDDMDKIPGILESAKNSSIEMMKQSETSISAILKQVEITMMQIGSLNIKPEKAEAIGNILNAFAAIITAITPSSQTLEALKETNTKDWLTGVDTQVQKLPKDKVIDFINTISTQAIGMISKLFETGGPLALIISITENMTKNQLDGLKAVGEVLGVMAEIFKLATPDPKIIDSLKEAQSQELSATMVGKTLKDTPIDKYFDYLSNVGTTFGAITSNIKPLIESILTEAKGMSSTDIKQLKDLSGVMSTLFGFLGTLAEIASPKTYTVSSKSSIPGEKSEGGFMSFLGGVTDKVTESTTTVLADVAGSMVGYMTKFKDNIMPDMVKIINALKDTKTINISNEDIVRINNIVKAVKAVTEIMTALNEINNVVEDSGFKIADLGALVGQQNVAKEDKLTKMSDTVKGAIEKITDPNSSLRQAIESMKNPELKFLDSAKSGGSGTLISTRLTTLNKIISSVVDAFTNIQKIEDLLAGTNSNPFPNIVNPNNIQASGTVLRDNLMGLSWFGYNVNQAWELNKGDKGQWMPNNSLTKVNTLISGLKTPLANLTKSFETLQTPYINDATLKGEGLSTAALNLINNLELTFEYLNSVADLKADIEATILDNNLLGGDFKYDIKAPGVHLELAVNVSMNAGEVEKVLVSRRDSVMRNAINYLGDGQKAITQASDSSYLIPVGSDPRTIINKLKGLK